MKYISKCWWYKNTGLLFDIANELFYVTNKKGNRVYHFVHFGYHDITFDGHKCITLVLTILWLQIGIGRIVGVRS